MFFIESLNDTGDADRFILYSQQTYVPLHCDLTQGYYNIVCYAETGAACRG